MQKRIRKPIGNYKIFHCNYYYDTHLDLIFFRQKTKQENDVLRSYLKAAQDDITILLEEKKALLDTIRSLQVC